MLAENKYNEDYIAVCKDQLEQQIRAFNTLAGSVDPGTAAQHALSELEQSLFTNMVLVLDHYFVHRTRAIEGKDGNPLNEVRMLSNSITRNGGVLAADKTIKYDPRKAVLKFKVGDKIKLSSADFSALAEAFLGEIESRFS